MTVLVISKKPFDVITLQNVSSITFNNETYTINGTVNYSAETYFIRII